MIDLERLKELQRWIGECAGLAVGAVENSELWNDLHTAMGELITRRAMEESRTLTREEYIAQSDGDFD